MALIKLMVSAVFLMGCSYDRSLPGPADYWLPGPVPSRPDLPDPVIPAADRAQARIAVALEMNGRSAVMGFWGQHGGYQTFATADRVAVTLHQGVLVATRGLSHDLMSATAPPMQPGHSRRRSWQVMGSDDRILSLSADCTLSRAAARPGLHSRLTEECHGDFKPFINTFDLDPKGHVVASRQWAGPGLGYLRIIGPAGNAGAGPGQDG